MKRTTFAIAAALCLVMAFALSACSSNSSTETKESAQNDVKLVEGTMERTVLDDPFYLLVMGLDTREGTAEDEGGGRASYSDTMVLVRVDPQTYRVGLVSIPRDTAADVDGRHVKINEAYYTNGPEGAVQAVEQLTGVHISYYMTSTFASFVDLVNVMGGVDGYVPMYMTLKDIMTGNTVELYEGEQHLGGAEALVWVRQRKQYPYEGEACRQQNTRAFLESAIRKVASDPEAVAQQVSNLTEHVETNIPSDALLEVVKRFSEHADEISFAACSGPYWGDINPENQLWEIARDEGTYQQIIAAIENGEDPQTIIINPM